jgi:hypothetical protein
LRLPEVGQYLESFISRLFCCFAVYSFVSTTAFSPATSYVVVSHLRTFVEAQLQVCHTIFGSLTLEVFLRERLDFSCGIQIDLDAHFFTLGRSPVRLVAFWTCLAARLQNTRDTSCCACLRYSCCPPSILLVCLLLLCYMALGLFVSSKRASRCLWSCLRLMSFDA